MSKQLLRDNISKIQVGQGSDRDIAKIVQLNDDGVSNLAGAKLIALDFIEPNPKQPRKDFNQLALEELAASIKERGILQPIRVRPYNGKYQIVAGERRWRASKLAGLEHIPAIVENISDAQSKVDSLIENLQREDLNDIERAEGIRGLKVTLGSSWDDVSHSLGIGKRSVLRLVALLDLPSEIQELIRRKAFNEKHGRALRKLNAEPEKQQEVTGAARVENLSGDDTVSLIGILESDPRVTIAEALNQVRSMKAEKSYKRTTRTQTERIIDTASLLQSRLSVLNIKELDEDNKASIRLHLASIAKIAEQILSEL
jgi:ParB/RepB/Spo0J family partition protein